MLSYILSNFKLQKLCFCTSVFQWKGFWIQGWGNSQNTHDYVFQPVYPVHEALYTVFIIPMALEHLKDFTQAVRMPPAADTAHSQQISCVSQSGNHRFCLSSPGAGFGRTWQNLVLPHGWQKVLVLPRTLLRFIISYKAYLLIRHNLLYSEKTPYFTLCRIRFNLMPELPAQRGKF